MRFGLAHDLSTRDGELDKDAMMQNAFDSQEDAREYVNKRPGLFAEFTTATGQGQGLFVWSPDGFPVLGAISGDTVYPSPTQLPKKLVFGTAPSEWKISTNYSPSVVVNAVTSSGSIDTSFSGTVTLSIVGPNAQGAALSGASVSASSGVATFSSLKVSKVGKYKIKATTTTLKPVTSSDVSIKSKIMWTTPPAPSYPGGPISNIVAKVTDKDGNTLTGFTGNLTISLADIDDLSSDDQPTLSGTRTVACVAGVATWTGLSIDKAGDWTFRVTDFPVNAGVNGVPDATYPYPPKWITYPEFFSNDSAGNLSPITSGIIETGWEFVFTTPP